jgi:hypothetical protein
MIELGIEYDLVGRVRGPTATALLIRVDRDVICHVPIDIAVSIGYQARRGRPPPVVTVR